MTRSITSSGGGFFGAHIIVGLCLAAATACGSSHSDSSGSGGGGGGSGKPGKPGTPIALTPTTVTATDGSSIMTALPAGLPSLTRVVGTLREDSVGVDFDPVDGAVDYRIYPLPKDEDITAFSDGTLTVKNAIYRCAGVRQTFDMKNNLNGGDSSLVLVNYSSTTQIDSDDTKNTLGFVYPSAGDGRVPVYAVAGDPADLETGWIQNRLKVYTTDMAARQALLDQNWRDDGIVFYVPAAADATTHTLYTSAFTSFPFQQYYFSDAGMAAHQSDPTPPAPAFQVLNAAADDAQALMAVLYSGASKHTELAVGKERFHRAAYQGITPDFHVEWSGLTEPTTLVIEALKNGCPFQGFLSPQHVDGAGTAAESFSAGHQTLFTLDELQQASATGEVFINGQYDDVVGKPQPIARSFLSVAPNPHKAGDWDWYQGFNSDLGPLTEIPGCTDFNCDHFQTTDLDINTYRIDNNKANAPVLALGQFLGQFWDAFGDYGQDVTGKIRITARTKPNIDADPDKYLHATMSVDVVSTDRRYPQLIISDQDAPVQEGFKNPDNNSVLVQPILGPATRLEVQAFHGLVPGLINSWDVNNQAPEHRLSDYDTKTVSAQPNDPLFEHASMDRLTKFDVFLSSKRIYVFIDSEPVGCSLLPSDVKLGGPVTFTVGDVLYHEGAPDERVCVDERPYGFMHRHQCLETKRHFDDLGFKSGTAPPMWDDKKFPCLPY